MRILVTGSSGHLGEALCRVLTADGVETVGLDILPSPYTDVVGSAADRGTVRAALEGVVGWAAGGGTARAALEAVDAIRHAATLHKPHVGSHSRQDFVETNITGT